MNKLYSLWVYDAEENEWDEFYKNCTYLDVQETLKMEIEVSNKKNDNSTKFKIVETGDIDWLKDE